MLIGERGRREDAHLRVLLTYASGSLADEADLAIGIDATFDFHDRFWEEKKL